MQMDVSEASAPVAHHEGQLVAGRYRLAALRNADEHTEVWRALDESARSDVTLQFLRRRDAETREYFVTEARRTAATEQPAAMRVAAIHDDEAETFVVWEHAAGVLAVPDALASQGEPTEAAIANAAPRRPALTALIAALRARDLAPVGAALLTAAALEIVAMARSWLADLSLDTILARARALLDRAVVLRTLFARAASSAGGTVTARARVGLPALPSMRVSMPKVSLPRNVPTSPAMPRHTARAMPRLPRMPRLIPHVRWGRVIRRGLSLGLVAAAIVVTPPEYVAYVGNTLTPALAEGVRTASETLERGVRAVTSPAPKLAPASFEVPPLSAYRAAFVMQAPHPTVAPDSTVEWVVVLRNTGSAGWYRGIDGAQASLVLDDGSTAGVQSTSYVGPGQVGWFVVRFSASSKPGTYNVRLYPRIDGQGALADLGIYAMVTVAAKP